MSRGPLDGKELLLIVGGGIAAYKSVTLAREMLRAGGTVETVLTPAAQRFVSGVTFAGITARAVRTDLWDPGFPGELHIALTSRADAIVVAPATADLLARCAYGLADDLATTCLAAGRGPLLFAPAMHPRMWENPANRAAVGLLVARGSVFAGPVTGPLASGETGIGRMMEPEAIAVLVAGLFVPRDLAGRRVLVTAGPTYEDIDPVRYVGNRSSGRMGYAIAERARARGAEVTLVSGPVALDPPTGVEVVRVRSAVSMRDAVISRAPDHDVVVMSAAVADYRPEVVATTKIKKTEDALTLRLTRNPDILQELGELRKGGRTPVLVGFAVETGDLVAHAREKLARKGCDVVVANLAEHGFEGTDNTVTIVTHDRVAPLGRLPKSVVADKILDTARTLIPPLPEP